MIRPGQYPSVDEHERQVAKQQEAAVSSDRSSRREVLAFIALQDLPMPLKIDFEWGFAPAVALWFDGDGDAEQWGEAFGVDLRGDYPGDRYIKREWRGLPLWLCRPNPLRSPVEPRLDEDTASALREIAGGDQ